MRGKGLPGYLPAGTWPGDPSPWQGHTHAAGVWFLGASGCWRQKSQLWLVCLSSRLLFGPQSQACASQRTRNMPERAISTKHKMKILNHC